MAGKISKERTISGVVLVILALATILPGGPILAITLYIISNIAFLELTKACGIQYRREAQCTGDYRISGNCSILSVDLFRTDTYVFHDYGHSAADGTDVSICVDFPKIHSQSGHDYILLPDLCTGHVILYLPDQTASLWNISGVDDLYQFLDL